MPTTKIPAAQVEAGERIGLGGIDEIRVEFVKNVRISYDGKPTTQALWVGDVFRAGSCGSFQPGFILRDLNETVEFLGTF
jgi:hypothetical protein